MDNVVFNLPTVINLDLFNWQTIFFWVGAHLLNRNINLVIVHAEHPCFAYLPLWMLPDRIQYEEDLAWFVEGVLAPLWETVSEGRIVVDRCALCNELYLPVRSDEEEE
ncbi:MAG: hypothetical protein AAGJ80_10900 [Cyanobacteria bacterium J06553_1]